MDPLTESEERDEPITAPATEDGAEKADAHEFVDVDKDRIKADARVNELINPAAPANSDRPAGDAPKKRGRPKMTEEEKARKRAEQSSRPAPNFSDLPGGNKPALAALNVPLTPRHDYKADAMSIFIPTSLLAGKMLGDHWGIQMDMEKKCFVLAPDQVQVVDCLGRWLEYKQFQGMNPTLELCFVLAAYTAPKLKAEPTGSKIKSVYYWLKSKITGKKREEPRTATESHPT